MEKRFQDFTTLIADIARYIQKIKQKEVAALGLKGANVTCLFYLYYYGNGQTAADLCRRSGEDKAAISRSLNELQKLGFLESNGNEKNYRSPLRLSEKGERAGKIIDDKVNRVVAEAGMGMTEAHREVLYSALGGISNNLKKICEE